MLAAVAVLSTPLATTSACATSGVLGRRGFPLESAAARVCREAGTRVHTYVMVKDLDLLTHDRVDNRRLEVIADPLLAWGSATGHRHHTCVHWHEMVQSSGVPTARTEHFWWKPEGGKNAPTRCWQVGGRAKLVLAAEVGGRSAKALSAPYLLQSKAKAGWLHRWSCLLGCTAAKSFAVSLLDGSAAGVGGSTPSVHDVLGERRYAPCV